MPPGQHMFPVRRVEAGPVSVVGWAVIGIFVILAFAAVAAARNFLMPVTMALLLFFVFVPLRRALDRRGVPAGVTAAAVTLAMVAAFAGIVAFMIAPALQIVENFPEVSGRLEQKFEALRGGLAALHDALARFETPPGEPAPEGEAAAEGVATAGGVAAVVGFVSAAPALIGQLVFTLFLLFFMLASGDLLYLKIVQSFDSLRDKRWAYRALREIEQSLGSYFGAITLINAGLGLAIGLAMWALGMPSPAMFGILAFVLNFIPYLGSVAGTVIAVVVALASFDGWTHPLLVGAVYVALSTIEGQLVTPVFVSRRLRMNTVVVFLAVALWAWLWSVLGMIVAVPVLVVMGVLCDHMPGLEKLGNFLGGEDPPAVDPDAEDEDEGPVPV